MGSNPACPTKPSPLTPPRDPPDQATRIAALDRALRASRSATETLEAWCGGQVSAVRIAGEDRPSDAVTRALLGAQPLRFRHVHLRRGDVVLSQAENWYVPARLTAAMNAALETGDEPFGRVVGPLGCRRHTLDAAVLAPGGAFVLEHRAVLVDVRGRTICVVRERYTREAAAMG